MFFHGKDSSSQSLYSLTGRLLQVKSHGVCCDIVSLRTVGRYTNKGLPKGLYQDELKTNNNTLTWTGVSQGGLNSKPSTIDPHLLFNIRVLWFVGGVMMGLMLPAEEKCKAALSPFSGSALTSTSKEWTENQRELWKNIKIGK